MLVYSQLCILDLFTPIWSRVIHIFVFCLWDTSHLVMPLKQLFLRCLLYLTPHLVQPCRHRLLYVIAWLCYFVIRRDAFHLCKVERVLTFAGLCIWPHSWKKTVSKANKSWTLHHKQITYNCMKLRYKLKTLYVTIAHWNQISCGKSSLIIGLCFSFSVKNFYFCPHLVG